MLVLISLVAIIIMKEKDKKKEREELYRNWMIWSLEEENEGYINALGKKLNETIQKKLEEMRQAD